MRKILLLLILSISFAASAANDSLVTEFITLSDKTKVKGAVVSDIENVALLLAEDMRYQHPNYSADLTKKEFIQGLKNYMGVADSLSTEIIDKIEGLNAISITYVSTTEMNGATEVDKKPLMRLFEFNDGKITLIKEYW
ncbi:nuclear transport factor 2 family protein [Thalassotalea sp. ND16A]|uniref:nuclear transport factor 2 family protein n=1 Tax=Thalassotalea sp. ND16A TaxID=1535422 RepID=UPI000519F76B|nr:nuclear transport factor 2 family protein [Thalassotalea sp. ND16A]KGJ88758.1 hypothetical protein ND16A_2460 [Thalassotalea sp. ND16A]